MEEQGLLEQIVTRAGLEMKELVAQVDQGKVKAAELERLVQGILREMGREATGVLLEAADRRLCAGKPLHDRRRARWRRCLDGRT